MEKTTRRNLLRSAAVGGVAVAGFGGILHSGRAIAVPARANELGDAHEHGQDDDDDEPLKGKRAAATISFGEWGGISGANPLDRFPGNHPNNRNVHVLLPNEVEIEAGGSVNFIIGGFHLVLIYDDGVQMGDIDNTKLTPGSSPPGLIDDPNHRIYRGLDPRSLSYVLTAGYVPPAGTTVDVRLRDRVEVVNFPVPGDYFVTCGVLPHFNQGMNGRVKVRERD